MTDREPTKLGTVLRTAREARFIDLARVERDTKIRVRYLSALERGDYRDLPEPIYTRGFLRNYGLYLGLDPEYLIDLYRLESGTRRRTTLDAATRRPMAARQGRSLVVSSGAVAAAILTILVVALVVYVVGELVIFGGTPDLRITDPAADVVAWEGDGIHDPRGHRAERDDHHRRPAPEPEHDRRCRWRLQRAGRPRSRRERHHPRGQRPADRPGQRRGAPHDHGGARAKPDAQCRWAIGGSDGSAGREARPAGAKIGERQEQETRWRIHRSTW